MSLNGMMRTGTSGMNAQANRLSTVAENIANSSTTGYKKAQTEFSSLLLPASTGSYNSGAMTTDIRYNISEQGSLGFTTSNTDLAIEGDGFFVVEDDNGTTFLTRAGSFTPDGDGYLVNSGGYRLLGADYATGTPVPVVNGFDGLVPVQIGSAGLTATASTAGYFAANLDNDEAVTAAALPSSNAALAEGTHQSSLVAFDSKGAKVTLDFYYTKTAANTWEVAVYDQAEATTGGTTSFPYASGPLSTETLVFDPASETLLGSSADSITFTVPAGESVTLDLSDMTETSYVFAVDQGTINGQEPSGIESIEISDDGIVYAKYDSGELSPIYRIGMATVPSPDRLNSLSGNVFTQSNESGVVTTGFANTNGFGKIISGALEGSNVDIAEELTMMIEGQRNYTANSKVFQTGSDLMDVLVNLAR